VAKVKLIEIKAEILADNRRLAERIRSRLEGTGTYLLNLMSSPGSGKTSLILRTIEALGPRYRIAVIEADLDSTVDADKVAAVGVPAVQLQTGGFCHVEAAMVEQALGCLRPEELDLVILENVGNLVCPAQSDTGAHASAVIMSVPEGDDKPLKYPLIFSVCDVVVLNKIDYLSLEDFDTAALKERLLRLNPRVGFCELSCRTGEGLSSWIRWLEKRLAGRPQRGFGGRDGVRPCGGV
jgi:hydrogenase nickel incorporation protein HypB